MVETLYMVGCLPHSFFTDHHAWFSTTHFTVIISVCARGFSCDAAMLEGTNQSCCNPGEFS